MPSASLMREGQSAVTRPGNFERKESVQSLRTWVATFGVRDF